jgi:N-acetylated-alpha-linked acidic dipeptidase
MNQFGDPGYRYHTLCAQVWGVLALRLANAEVLPCDFAFYADNIRQFVAELKKGNEAERILDFPSLVRLVGDFESAGRRLNQEIERALNSRGTDLAAKSSINHQLMEVERNWLNPEGIPGRPWFKHILYAARYTYAHLELPGLTEAVERSDWKVAAEQIQILASAVSRNVELLRTAREGLRNSNAGSR